MSVAEPDLWTLTHGRPQVDPDRLAAAVERQALGTDLDFRTRLLIRDSVDALARFWGPDRMRAWLAASPAAMRIEAVRREQFDSPGFPSLAARLMPATDPKVVLQFLRELGSHIQRPTRIDVGGSAALIIAGRLHRQTEDVDVVNEVPSELRTQYALMDDLSERYGLHLAHFQSHYLPRGWESRVQPLGQFGRLDVYTLDPYDIFLSKLFSVREKDRDDLRALAPQLDRSHLVTRLRADTAALSGEQRLRQAAATNWHILFGEVLPG